MSYKLISAANFVVISASGVRTERAVEVRVYPAPKREPSAMIDVDGVSVPYKRTGGKGRGSEDNLYLYAMVKGASGFWKVSAAESEALVGGTCSLTCVEKVAEPAAAAPAEPVVANAKPAVRRVKATA